MDGTQVVDEVEEEPTLSPEEDAPVHRPWWKTLLRWLGEFAIYLVIAVLVVTLIRLFLVQPFLVPSGSMENTLQVDDTIVAWKPGAPQRGEIVVFRDDLGWLPPLGQDPPMWKTVLAWIKVLPPQDEQYLVKRLIGLPGDHVVCCDFMSRIVVNDVPLDENDYLLYRNPEMAFRPFDLVVPEGRMFVMGDHRDSSRDSRAILCGEMLPPGSAFPSLDSIQGAVFAIMRPLDRVQTFSIPSDFDEVGDPSDPAPDVDHMPWSCN